MTENDYKILSKIEDLNFQEEILIRDLDCSINYDDYQRKLKELEHIDIEKEKLINQLSTLARDAYLSGWL